MRQETTLQGYPLPNSDSLEIQVIADLIVQPETVMEAERIMTEEMFNLQETKDAWSIIKTMSKEGKVIDLPTLYGKLSKSLADEVIRLMPSSGGYVTSIQHYATLKECHIKRKCYFSALSILSSASNTKMSATDIISNIGNFAESIRKEIDTERGTQHIAEVLNDLGDNIEQLQKDKASGKVLRVPTGFSALNYLTYGGFNSGNLVILAARPSVGKTAIMLQMAKAAAFAGKSVSLFNLEMTNTELAQRFLFSTGQVTPLQIAKGEVMWDAFDFASSQFAEKPIYMNDSSSTADEIISSITLNSQAGKCDIAFIDYLGLINMGSGGKTPLHQAIAECTKRLKQTAKTCRIPIVLLCQLNRASASEKRAPALYDLRDSGSIEQDADIVLMLERASDEEKCSDINMWVRKNRQGKAGDVVIELQANETFTSFSDKDERRPSSDPFSDLGNFANNNNNDTDDLPL